MTVGIGGCRTIVDEKWKDLINGNVYSGSTITGTPAMSTLGISKIKLSIGSGSSTMLWEYVVDNILSTNIKVSGSFPFEFTTSESTKLVMVLGDINIGANTVSIPTQGFGIGSNGLSRNSTLRLYYKIQYQ